MHAANAAHHGQRAHSVDGVAGADGGDAADHGQGHMRDTDSTGASRRTDAPQRRDGGGDSPRGGGHGAGTRPPVSNCAISRRDTRGQSVNDFALGVGVFVISVAFVFFLVPTLLAPYYTPSETGNEIRAERSTTVLVDDLFAKSGEHEPNTLNTTCTEAFFDVSGSPPYATVPGCPYNGGSLDEALGLNSGDRVNVTISDLGSGTSDVVTIDGTELKRGSPVPPKSNVGVWTRVVYLNGTSRELTVRVW